MLDTATTMATADAGEGETAPSSGPDGRWRGRLVVIGILSLAIPVIAALVVAFTQPWLPPSDHALIQIRTRDVGGPLTPMLGSYSRLGWNHPGPLAFWLLAVPYRLLGASTEGMLVGALVINAAALVGCVLLARRLGGRALVAIVAVALAALLRGYGAGFLFHIWNPDLPALPTAFLILATWAVIEGELRLLPLVVGVSCFVWQTHIGYVPLAGGLAGVAVLAAAVHLVGRRRAAARAGTSMPPPPWLLLGATVVTALVCLAPLLVEQATTDPGNLRLIIDSFRNPQEPVAGFGRALRIAAKHLAPTGTWITGHDPANPFTAAAVGDNPWWLALPALALLGASLAAWRARAFDALRLLGLMALVAVLGIVAVARTTGEPYNYLLPWFRPIGALVWVAVAWALLRSAPMLGRGVPALGHFTLRDLGAGLVAVLTVALSISSLTNASGLEHQETMPAHEIEALVHGTLRAVEGLPAVNLRARGGWCAGEVGQGLALQMIEHGTEVAVVPDQASRFGAERVREDVVPTVELVCGPVAKSAAAVEPEAVVATYNILTDEEEAELAAVKERLLQQLRQAGRESTIEEVNAPTFPLVIEFLLTDVPFEAGDVARFKTLAAKADRSAAVFLHPLGLPAPT